MINSYITTSQEVAVNEGIVFDLDRVKTGCSLSHVANTSSFTLKKPGYYLVSFNGSASTTETAGNIEVQLFSNGVEVPGASSTFYSAAPINIGALGFSAIIQIRPSCCSVDNISNLSIVNTGVEATYTDADLVIAKIC